MIFTTERLVVRKLAESDFDAFNAMQGDDQVMQYVHEGSGLSVEENRLQLEHCITAYDQPNNNFWVWAIVDSAGQFVGTCAIVDNDGAAEIGYRFLRSFWGNGFGKEIVDPLIDHAVNGLGKKRVIALVDTRNEASVRVLEFSQLRFVGEENNGEIVDRRYVLQVD